MTNQLEPLFFVMLVASLVPVVLRPLPVAIPQVVLFLVGGGLIGPDVLSLAERDQVTMLRLRDGTLLPENAAALVRAGALSAAVFPFAALQIRRRSHGSVSISRSSDAAI